MEDVTIGGERKKDLGESVGNKQEENKAHDKNEWMEAST